MNNSKYFLLKNSNYYYAEDLCKKINQKAGNNIIVFDFYKTLSLFTSKECNDLYEKLKSKFKIIILSYVGFNTQTRIKAEKELEKYKADYKILCFKRGSEEIKGNKGYFISRLIAKNIYFFDDSDDHIESVKNTDVISFKVPHQNGK